MSWNHKQRRLLLAATSAVAMIAWSSVASAQVVISEFLSDDAAGSGEFIEIYNSGTATVDLSGYTIADEETVGGGEGAASFPSGTSIASGEIVVVTEDATALQGGSYAPVAGTQVFEWSDSDSDPANDLVDNEALATGNIALSNGGDEILLFDASDTQIDAVAYGGNSVSGYPSVGAPGDDLSAIRQNLDNQPALAADWASDQTPTPGAVPFSSPGATCADDPCGPNQDCDDSSGDIVCTCSDGFVDDGTGSCIESCETAGCSGDNEVCNTDSGLCECDSATTDYGNGTCVASADITCAEGDLPYGFLGQAGDDTIPNGGCLTDDPSNLADAGIGQLLTAIGNGEEVLSPPIEINGAVVAATDETGGKQSFYLQGANGTIGTFLNGADQPPFDLRVGQKVSLTVTEVGEFFSNPQINGAENWSIESDGNFVAAPTPDAAIGEADAAQLVHIDGRAVEDLGDAGPCNAGECYRVATSDGTVEVVITTDASNIELGSLVEIVAPLEWRGDLGSLRVSTFTNSFWATTEPPECSGDEDCTAPEACVDFICQIPPDECDDNTPCEGTGETCDTSGTPNECVCDADERYIDDGGTCVQVECIDTDDCSAVGQTCESNSCACPAGSSLNGDETACVATQGATAGSLFISEALFDGPSNPEAEFVEVYNGSGSSIDISGFTLTDGEGTVTVSAGTSIADGEYIIFTRSQTLLQNEFSGTDFSGVTIIQWGGSIALSNGSDEVVLRDGSGDLVDAIGSGSGSEPPLGFPQLVEDAVGNSPGNAESWERLNFDNTPSFESDWRVNDTPSPGSAAAQVDVCDTENPCVEEGRVCDETATPSVCVCDTDNFYRDDGLGGCEQVECFGDDDCTVDGQTCNVSAGTCDCPAGEVVDTGTNQCYDPSTDECDASNACAGEGEICNEAPTPNVCECDEDNLYIGDGSGGCVQVECIDVDDCTVDGQSCNANVCECPEGQAPSGGICVDEEADVIFTEVVAQAFSHGTWSEEEDEFIELYNRGTGIADLEGYAISDVPSDDANFDSDKYTIGELLVSAGEYLVVSNSGNIEDEWNLPDSAVAISLDGAFGIGGDETLYLYDDTNNLVASVELSGATEGLAQARTLTSGEYDVSGDDSADFESAQVPTPGADNDTAPLAADCGNGTREPGELCDPAVSRDSTLIEACCDPTSCTMAAAAEDMVVCNPADSSRNDGEVCVDRDDVCQGNSFITDSASDNNACDVDAALVCDSDETCNVSAETCDDDCGGCGVNERCDGTTLDDCVCAPGFEDVGDTELDCQPIENDIRVLITEVQATQPTYVPWVEYDASGNITAETDGQFEYIELHNPTAEAISLDDYTLTTSPLTAGENAFTIPTGTSIESGGYIIVAVTDDFDMMWNVDSDIVIGQASTADAAPVTLSAEGEAIYLYPGDAVDDDDYIDAMAYGTEIGSVFASDATLESAAAGYVMERIFDGIDFVDTDSVDDWETTTGTNDDTVAPTPGAHSETTSSTCADGSGTLDAGEVCDPDLAADVCCTDSCLPSDDDTEVCRSTDMCVTDDITCDGVLGGCLVLPTDLAAEGDPCDDGNADTINDECTDDGMCVGEPDEPTCGDGICEGDETATSCPQDCDTDEPVCGDGTCDPDEDADTCPSDCDTDEPVCGNNIVEGDEECDGGEGCTDECTFETDSGGGGGGCSSTASTSTGLAGLLLGAIGAIALFRRRRRK